VIDATAVVFFTAFTSRRNHCHGKSFSRVTTDSASSYFARISLRELFSIFRHLAKVVQSFQSLLSLAYQLAEKGSIALAHAASG
jgi:hypothetical protein